MEELSYYTPRLERVKRSILWSYLVGLPGAHPSGDSTWIQYENGVRLILITDQTKAEDMRGLAIRNVYIAGTYDEWLRCPAECAIGARLNRLGDMTSPMYFMNFWDPEPIPEAMVRADFIQTSKRTPQHQLQDVIGTLTDLGAQVDITYIIDHMTVKVLWLLEYQGYGRAICECNRTQLEMLVDQLNEVARRLAAYVNKDSKGTT